MYEKEGLSKIIKYSMGELMDSGLALMIVSGALFATNILVNEFKYTQGKMENTKKYEPEGYFGKKYPKGELKKRLTQMQYKVTQENNTEPPFNNEYWDNKEEGIYVDIVSGEPLFSSKNKFDSKTGWPSFIKPLEKSNIVELIDRSLPTIRTELRSKNADSHLGHLFKDGPEPTGLRYCINSASLRFIPREELEKEGYEKYEKLFEE